MENITIRPDVAAEGQPALGERAGHRVAICIIARNEADAIGGLIDQLAAQSLVAGEAVSRILVVSNGSSDATAARATSALARAFADGGPIWSVHDTPVGGKARSWNLAVHELLGSDLDIAIFLDADIELAGTRVLTELVSRLAGDPALLAMSGFPLKHIARKKHKSLVDLFSLRVSSQTPAPHVINGSLYAARMSELRKIWLPVPTPGEDGALSAMIHTSGFTHAPRFETIARMPHPTHYFEAHSIAGFFVHEQRMTLGTTINGWIFEHLWAGEHSTHVGECIRAWNEDDPDWIDRIIAREVAGKWWALPPRMLSWRLHNLRGVGLRKAVTRVPFSLAATLLNLGPCFVANRLIKRRGAAGHW